MRKRVLAGIIVGAVVIRLFALFVALHTVGQQGFITGDAIGYVELAHHISNGEGFAVLQSAVLVPEVFRTPGFPLLLAAFSHLSYGIALYGVLFSIIAGIALPLCTYFIAKRVVSHRASLLATLMIALEPHAVFYSFLLQTEMPFMVFTFGGLLAAINAFERRSYTFAALAGGLLGYAIFIRPGYLPVFTVLLLGTVAWLIFKKDGAVRQVVTVGCCMAVVLCPWFIRNHGVTGVYSLSGAGWRNVYTDYLASVRSIKNDTAFYEEKHTLKDEAMPRFGLTPEQVSDPANANVLRDAALPELWANRWTVLKLETILLFSYFTHDGYYYDFRNLGYVSDSGVANISPTHELMTKGIDAVPAVFGQLSRQMFIPIWGRLFTISIFLLSIVGFFLVRSKLRYLFVCAIVCSAVIATAIGFGLDARMRVPAEPLFFIFAAAAGVSIFERVQSRYAR